MFIELMILFFFLNYLINLSIIFIIIEFLEFFFDYVDKIYWKNLVLVVFNVYIWFCLVSMWSFFKELNLNIYCIVVNIFDIYCLI